jgi:hypothetical protein
VKRLPLVIGIAALALAAGSGYLASVAIGQGSPPITKTVTVDVATGPTGPTGPQGPAGGIECPAGYTFNALRINTPQGHTQIATCIQD